MISWIALVVAILAIALVVLHAVIPDRENGGIAHTRQASGALGRWLLRTFPSLQFAPASPTIPTTAVPVSRFASGFRTPDFTVTAFPSIGGGST